MWLMVFKVLVHGYLALLLWPCGSIVYYGRECVVESKAVTLLASQEKEEGARISVSWGYLSI